MRTTAFNIQRSFVVAKPAEAKDMGSEQAAAHAKAIALMKHVGTDGHAASAAPTGFDAFEQYISSKVTNLVAQVPGLEEVPSLMTKAGRCAGPVIATAAFGFSAFDTVKQWGQRTHGEHVGDVVATTASGIAAAGAIAAGVGVTGAIALVGPAAGIAGTIFAARSAKNAMEDVTRLPGQKGLAAAAVVLQGVGTVLTVTPFAPLGVVMMLAGGSCGVFAEPIGKMQPVNSLFKAMGF